MPKAEEAQATRINTQDVFDGIFAMVKLRSYDGIDPERSGANGYLYVNACIAVTQRVMELSKERGDECTFRMRPHQIHGTCPDARQVINYWLGSGCMHLRVPGVGFYYFSIFNSQATEILEDSMHNTGYTREIFTELTELFLNTYNNLNLHSREQE